jgi:hypothetical protein
MGRMLQLRRIVARSVCHVTSDLSGRRGGDVVGGENLNDWGTAAFSTFASSFNSARFGNDVILFDNDGATNKILTK